MAAMRAETFGAEWGPLMAFPCKHEEQLHRLYVPDSDATIASFVQTFVSSCLKQEFFCTKTLKSFLSLSKYVFQIARSQILFIKNMISGETGEVFLHSVI